jgi:O-antigen ligase
VRRGDPETGIPRNGDPDGAGRAADGTAERSRAATAPLDRARRVGGPLASREGLGFFFSLLLVYLLFEYGRPSNPMGIPMLISVLSLGGWLVRRDKRWSSQITGFLVFVVVMALEIPMAVNTYSAFWTTYGMAVSLLCICAPLPSLVTSVRRIRVWAYTFLAVAVYVGGYALLHEGYGPSGSAGGQDENYVAAMMGMAIPFAYFSFFAETRRVGKVLLALSIVVFCGAIVVGRDASRGGFLGVCAVVLYCLARSPRKLVGFSVVAVMGLTVMVIAGPAYWQQIATIGDVHEGTTDMRIEVWKIGMRMFQAYPVFGVGPGNFPWMVGEYQSPEQLNKYGRNLGGSIVAHSLFVELLAELGIAGAVVLVGLLWRTWRDLRQVQRGGSGPPGTLTVGGDLDRLRCYADAVIASILACLVAGAFLSLLYYSYLWLLIALGSAITQVFRSQVATQPV